MLKNVTLSAEEALLRQAREKAIRERKSLNELFRQWLARYIGAGARGNDFERLMRRMGYAVPGRKFTRDETNAR